MTRLRQPLLVFHVATSVEYVKRMMNRPYYARALLLADLTVSFISKHNIAGLCTYEDIETSGKRGEHDVNFTLHCVRSPVNSLLAEGGNFFKTLTIIHDVCRHLQENVMPRLSAYYDRNLQRQRRIRCVQRETYYCSRWANASSSLYFPTAA